MNEKLVGAFNVVKNGAKAFTQNSTVRGFATSMVTGVCTGAGYIIGSVVAAAAIGAVVNALKPNTGEEVPTEETVVDEPSAE